MPKNLKKLYENVYATGKDKFFTFNTIDITKEVTSQLCWRGKYVLEVGCGTGESAFFLAKRGAKVTAMDYSENAIKETRNKYVHKNLNFKRGSFEDIRGLYDCILLQEVIEHTDDPFKIFKLLKKHLKERGHLIVTCPNFLNLRGIIWMTLQILLDVPMSLTDKQFITPGQMEGWARKLNFDLTWRTFRHAQAHGELMFTDMSKRLSNALRDARLKNTNVNKLLNWLKEVSCYEKDLIHNGAKAIYHFRKKVKTG